jgi:Uma2 family endonuclease
MSSLALKDLEDLRRPVHPTLPTMYDLPSEDIEDDRMPDDYHHHESVLLSETFQPPTFPPDQVYTAQDLFIYYDSEHPRWHKSPDWFAVLGAARTYKDGELRYSYVLWHEGLAPLIIIEFLSERTKKEDLGQTVRRKGKPPTKWEVYERILRVPYYVVFSRAAERMRVFKLNGERYTEAIGHGDRLWIPEAGLWLGVWRGVYQKFERPWLRWQDAQGVLIPTNAERLEKESLRLEQERLRVEQSQIELARERERSERLAEMLRQMGQDPDQV